MTANPATGRLEAHFESLVNTSNSVKSISKPQGRYLRIGQ
jgi:hypothetical protein